MENLKTSGVTVIVAALLVSLGVGIAGFFIGNTLYKSRIGLNTARVKGLSERRVMADRASWSIGFSVVDDGDSSIPELYEKGKENQGKIIDYLKGAGIKADELTKGIISYSSKEYRNENQELVESKNFFSGQVLVETSRTEVIEPARAEINSLVVEGIFVQNNSPQFHFNGLNDIKPAMVEEATRNARIAAEEFAKNAGVSVGKIRSAQQGGFTIVDFGESYGDKKRLEKDVRVVTTVEFYLTD